MTPGRRAPSKAGRAPAGALPRHCSTSAALRRPTWTPALLRRAPHARVAQYPCGGVEVARRRGYKPRPQEPLPAPPLMCLRRRPRASGIVVGLAWPKTGVNQNNRKYQNSYTNNFVDLLLRRYDEILEPAGSFPYVRESLV